MEKEVVPSEAPLNGLELRRKYLRWLNFELAGLCVLMAIVWGLLMVPIILYYLRVDVHN